MKFFEKIKIKIRGTLDLDKLKKDGLIVGENFDVQSGCIIDPGHCWLIRIGNNVTLAPNVHILAHDASTKKFLGYTKIDNVIIGNNVFIGAGTIILPGVIIEDDVIVGAGSVVTKKIEKNSVYAGVPAKKICSLEDYLKKNINFKEKVGVFDKSYTYFEITEEKKIEQYNTLKNNGGGLVE